MADDTAKAVGDRIRQRRKALGISQPKLAELLHVPQQTIAGWENGKAKIPRRLIDAAKVLCTTPEWLLREEGPEVVLPPQLRKQLSETVESLPSELVPAALEFLRSLQRTDTEAA